MPECELAYYNFLQHVIPIENYAGRCPGQFDNLRVKSARLCTILRDVKVW